MADRLSWLALLAALTFSFAIVVLGRGASASNSAPAASAAHSEICSACDQ